MRVKNSIVIIFLLFTSFLISQESKIKTFNGQVINDDVEKSGIVVINKNSGGKVITNKDGYFQIGVRLNDSIYLRSVQIKTHYIIINEDVFKSDSIKVNLEPLVNQLSNVTVKPYDLSGDLMSDIKKVEKKETINFKDVGVPGFKGKREEKIAYKSTGNLILNALLLPLTPFDIEGAYKQLSGYYKNLKIARGLEKRYESVAGIIQFYGINYFKSKYNLKDSDLYEFILGAVENYDIENNFKNSNHGLVLKDFNKFYVSIYN